VAEPLRALAITAHPDDIEFGCAGTVARWVDEGAEVTFVIVTDGSTGTVDTTLMGERLADVRRDETVRAAKVLGVTDVVFLGYRDGYVEPTLDLRRDLAREFRKARPHTMFVMDPQPLPGAWFVNHPDHRAVGQASLDITVTAGTTPGHFPELLDEGHVPWRGLREIYLTGPGGGKHAVDITTTIDRKIEALKTHASQVGEWEGLEDMMRGWAKQNGVEHGFEYAELFQLIKPLGAEP
jgi:LmbE family N-acetylglucosaminyl deacetylase